MSLKRQMERQKRKVTEGQKKRLEMHINQRVMDARLAGVDEAVRYFEARMENVKKIKGIGPKLFTEICFALGFEEVANGQKKD
jgi:hypothetical protein